MSDFRKKITMAFFLAVGIVLFNVGCKNGSDVIIPDEFGMHEVANKITEEFCENQLVVYNWDANLSLSTTKFVSAKEGDTIVIKAKTNSDKNEARINIMNTNWQPIYLEQISCTPKAEYISQYNNDAKKDVSKIKLKPYNGTYTIKITLTQADADLLKEGGLLFSGSDFIFTSVKLSYTKYTYESDKSLEEQYELLSEKRETVISKYSKKYSLPIIYITTNNLEDVVKKEYYDSIVDVVNCDEKFFLSDDIEERKAGVKVRGNSTAWGDEKPYRIKFNKKNPMLGLHNGNKYKSWVLLKTGWSIACDFLGFNLAHEIYRSSKFNYYASDATYVHVIINGNYKGMYLLCEQNQTGKGRVNVYEPEKDETTTKIGYMIELDNYAWEDLKDGNGRWFGENGSCSKGIEDYHFTLNYVSADEKDNEKYEEWGSEKTGLKLKDINEETRIVPSDDFTLKNDVYSDEQVIFIQKYMKGVWDICYNAIQKNKFYKLDENFNLVAAPEFSTAKEACEAVIDLESLANEMILEELVRDNDVGAGSLYMAVDFTVKPGKKYSKLTFECPWDFNWAYGTYSEDEEFYKGKTRYYAGAWQPKYVNTDNYERSHPWFILFNNAPWFRKMQLDKWKEIGPENLKETLVDVESKLEIPLKECNVSQTTTTFVKNRIDYIDKELWKN